jgi:hypothetical protein
MPTRTIVQELCDVCFAEDDEEASEATDRLRFGWLGHDYVLLVCNQHVDEIRDELQRLSDLGSPEGGRRPRRTTRPAAPTRRPRSPQPAPVAGKTLFSQLDAAEKERFRAWAEMPTARRIGDKRVEEWIAAGKP